MLNMIYIYMIYFHVKEDKYKKQDPFLFEI